MMQLETRATAPVAARADSSSPISTIPTAQATIKTHLVKAGSGSFRFEPARLENVSVGDVVTFEFYPPDHSVARAEFGSPCMPYEYTGKDKKGFWSQTQWVNNTSEITHWNLTINSTEPIFYYCAAPGSCKDKLMVGCINPDETQTLEAQMRAAKVADIAVAPGEPIPKEMVFSLPSQPPATTSFSPPQAHGPPALSDGAIAGIVLGGVVVIVLCISILLVYVTRARSKAASDPKRMQRRTNYTSYSQPLTISSCPTNLRQGL